jgi:antitoxin VapB
MPQTAVLFKDGHDQAVRLPAEFRFAGTEVAIRKDEATGEVILSPTHTTKESWQEFFDRADSITFPEDFLTERDLQPAANRDLL